MTSKLSPTSSRMSCCQFADEVLGERERERRKNTLCVVTEVMDLCDKRRERMNKKVTHLDSRIEYQISEHGAEEKDKRAKGK
ncbi:hypothetical protein DPMN_083667 [Dreissena polymorpha]|uniref:Uncharacterized protein n=1 Tax=Dreissena polymorpha TaxID=45954 RepID=A0A9D4BIH8_DREPO|nr:hypothetical protein DPMN_083667 [Dreissena polymorpha]